MKRVQQGTCILQAQQSSMPQLYKQLPMQFQMPALHQYQISSITNCLISNKIYAFCGTMTILMVLQLVGVSPERHHLGIISFTITLGPKVQHIEDSGLLATITSLWRCWAGRGSFPRHRSWRRWRCFSHRRRWQNFTRRRWSFWLRPSFLVMMTAAAMAFPFLLCK